MTVGYKVLTTDLQSISKLWCPKDEAAPWVVQYQINKIVRRKSHKFGNLMIFDSMLAAKEFISYHLIKKYVIAECHGLLARQFGKHYEMQDLRHFYDIIDGKYQPHYTPPPSGTWFCIGVRLIKIVSGSF